MQIKKKGGWNGYKMGETQKPKEEETQESKQEGTPKSEQQETKETPEREKIELPPVNFINFINSLASTAFMYMGGVVDPETKKPIIELNLAKHQIDIIEMLQQKTKGNLTTPENNFLENILYNLRMSYVRLSTMPPPTEEAKTEQANSQNEKDD
ncbi:MAG: DUF1844 domain-containing protein [Candidatus Poribacteria bacterium]